jgi:cell division protein ZapA
LESPKGSAKVTIFGNEYQVQASEDPGYIEKIARYVDGKMRELQSRSTISSSTKIAILVAMNIADELHKELEAKDAIQRDVDERAGALELILEGQAGD